jgi:hypothetical protein
MREDVRLGLATLCIGGGMDVAERGEVGLRGSRKNLKNATST